MVFINSLRCNRGPVNRVSIPLTNPLIDYFPQGRFVHTEVVASGRLNVGVASQFFDEHDVGTIVKKMGAIGMPEHVRSQVFVDPSPLPQLDEIARHIRASPALRRITRGDE
jgi:hypothetical protein